MVGQVHFEQPVWDLELKLDLQGLELDSDLQDLELGFELQDPEPDFVLQDLVLGLQDLALHLHSDLEHLG